MMSNSPQWQGLQNPLKGINPQNPFAGYKGLQNPLKGMPQLQNPLKGGFPEFADPLKGWKGLRNPFK